MKKVSFAALFFGTQVLFVFLQIHKTSYLTKCSYQKQKYEQRIAELTRTKQELLHTLHALHNSTDIKQFAEQTLHMKPVKLLQIKRLYANN